MLSSALYPAKLVRGPSIQKFSLAGINFSFFGLRRFACRDGGGSDGCGCRSKKELSDTEVGNNRESSLHGHRHRHYHHHGRGHIRNELEQQSAALHSHPDFPVRNDWTKDEIKAIYEQPLLELIYTGATAHRTYFTPSEVQKCTLLSIKTGGCSEDCKYCSQSSKYKTDVKAEKLMEEEEVIQAALKAKEAGSTRFCMGAAWRGASSAGKRQFDRVLGMISKIRAMDMEVCATLGMINEEQAKALRNAGLTAYNHNIDTSEEYYPKVITSRTFQDRMETLKAVRSSGLSVCCGGIIGMGESVDDRVSMIHSLATLSQHPESVPINALVANKGTPFEDLPPLPSWTLVRMVATARIVMPASMVRLSAGRNSLSQAEQAMCFLAGANSIFTGDKLLTTANVELDQDESMFDELGLKGKAPFGGGSRQDIQQPQQQHSESLNGRDAAELASA